MEKPTVILRETFNRSRKRWVKGIIIMNLFWMAVIGSLYTFEYRPLIMDIREAFSLEKEKNIPVEKFRSLVHEYKVRNDILIYLRKVGLSIGQGFDIVEALFLYSKQNNLPIDFVLGVMMTESEFYPAAKSNKGAIGIMQVMPSTAKEYAPQLGVKEFSPSMLYDPIVNIKFGTGILGALWRQHSAKNRSESEVKRKVLTEYNAGPGPDRVAETGYVKTVEKNVERFRFTKNF
jgi:soluble lytic murein transglycosylase-like protein